MREKCSNVIVPEAFWREELGSDNVISAEN